MDHRGKSPSAARSTAAAFLDPKNSSHPRASSSASQGTDGWEIQWDVTNNKWFYQNRVLGISSFDRPEGCKLEPQAGKPSQEFLRPPKEGLPPGWESAVDPTHNRAYYFNRMTGERTWKRDDMYKSGSAARSAAIVGVSSHARKADDASKQEDMTRLEQRLGMSGGSAASAGASNLPSREDMHRLNTSGPSSASPSGSSPPMETSYRGQAARVNASGPSFASAGGGGPPVETSYRGTTGAGPSRTTSYRAAPSSMSPENGKGRGRRPPSRETSREHGRAPAGDDWDAQGWKGKMSQVHKEPDPRKASRVLLRQVSEHNYNIRYSFSAPRTRLIAWQETSRWANSQPDRRGEFPGEPEISFSYNTTADAVQQLGTADPRAKLCLLNFANGVQAGGGYKTGAVAQEEDLCRRFPGLYTTLMGAVRDNFFPFGPSTYHSTHDIGRYCDVLWTSNVTLGRASQEDGFALLPVDKQVNASVVSAAAPNIRFADPPEHSDPTLMGDTIRNVFLAPKMMKPDVTTLILGAWGCGAFGGNPTEISELFCGVMKADRLARLYKRIHFAIPRMESINRDNATIFLEALKSSGFRVNEIT